MQTITLKGYGTNIPPYEAIELGTYDSYGVEQLQIVPAHGWENLSIIASFFPPSGAEPIKVAVLSGGIIDVPPGATAKQSGKGIIVFAGYKANTQLISTNVAYNIRDHKDIASGDPVCPTPSVVDQIVNAAKAAQEDAQAAAQDASEAKANANKAQQEAENAAADAAKAGPYAEAALNAQKAAEAARDTAIAAGAYAENAANTTAGAMTAAAESASKAAASENAAAASENAAAGSAKQAEAQKTAAAKAASDAQGYMQTASGAASAANASAENAAGSKAAAASSATASANSATAAAASATTASAKATEAADSASAAAASEQAAAQAAEIAQDAAESLKPEVDQIKDDLLLLNNNTETSVSDGYVWTTNASGAGWAEPQDHDYKLIDTITVEQVVDRINIDFDNPLKAILLCFNAAVSDASYSGAISLLDGQQYASFGYITKMTDTTQKVTLFEARLYHFGVYANWFNSGTTTYPSANTGVYAGITRYFTALEKISKLNISCSNIPVGTVVTIMGVEK